MLKTKFHIIPDNVLILILEFCDIEDIINLSLSCKELYKLLQKYDFKFEDVIAKNFFSNYNKYE
jgi:hypothetical protein